MSIWKEILVAALLASIAEAQPRFKALVGGTLIDGYGAAPIRNSVIIIEGERIVEVGVTTAIDVSCSKLLYCRVSVSRKAGRRPTPQPLGTLTAQTARP